MKTSRDKRDLEEAKERVERAKRYAVKFPSFIHPSDAVFQDVTWQLKQLKSFNEKCAPQK